MLKMSPEHLVVLGSQEVLKTKGMCVCQRTNLKEGPDPNLEQLEQQNQ